MPIKIENLENGTWVRHIGFIAPSEFLDSLDRLVQDPYHSKRRYLLCDLTEMDSDSIWAITPEITDKVGAHNKELQADRTHLRKLAFVASSSKLREQCRAFAEKYVASPNAEVRIFHSVALAWTWVRSGIDDA